MERGELTLHGWVYDIGSGRVKGLDAGGRRFVPLGGDELGVAGEPDVLASAECDEELWRRL